MATHKELSELTNDELTKYQHLRLKIRSLEDLLTPEQANVPVPPSITVNIDKLYILFPIQAPSPETIAELLKFLNAAMDFAPLALPIIEKIVNKLSHLF